VQIDIVGERITAVRPMTAEELAREAWTPAPFTQPLALELADGVVLYAACDPEGNGPGVLFGRTHDGQTFTLGG